MRAPKAATESTKALQQSFKQKLNFDDNQSFEDARRGFIATLAPMSIEHDKGVAQKFKQLNKVLDQRIVDAKRKSIEYKEKAAADK